VRTAIGSGKSPVKNQENVLFPPKL
jgi:hypothetical protein